MIWNWQQEDWPNFSYEKSSLEEAEAKFLRQSGVLQGSYKHICDDDKAILTVDLMSDEAYKTSEIEGEILNRASLHSSIRRHFGLASDTRKVPAAERGIADMMIDLYRNYADPLTHESLFAWHEMIMSGRTDMKDIGRYRTHKEAMQVVSGAIYKPKVHFEAPPSKTMTREMTRFISWFNKTAPNGSMPLPALTRAGIAHLYFVCIHPFEDGNGRIGRGLAEKALAQSLGQPSLIALSYTILSMLNRIGRHRRKRKTSGSRFNVSSPHHRRGQSGSTNNVGQDFITGKTHHPNLVMIPKIILFSPSPPPVQQPDFFRPDRPQGGWPPAAVLDWKVWGHKNTRRFFTLWPELGR